MWTDVSTYVVACTESKTGSDSSRIMITYTRKNGKVYLNGQKPLLLVTGTKNYLYILVIFRNAKRTWNDVQLPPVYLLSTDGCGHYGGAVYRRRQSTQSLHASLYSGWLSKLN
ncbi:crotonobetainyl-CoA dehydrogenase [Salmonella enterica subsp. diarizonae]|nr:crotonobetainyl-CoA dehydrogenase [Salmonella enterica subsp. diarizonae]